MVTHQLEKLHIHSLSILSKSIQQSTQGLAVKEGHGQEQHMAEQAGMHLLGRPVTPPYGDGVTHYVGHHQGHREGHIHLQVVAGCLGVCRWVDALW